MKNSHWVIERKDLGSDMPSAYVSVASGGHDIHWMDRIKDAKKFDTQKEATEWIVVHLGYAENYDAILYKPE